jgi:hypothetical protein
MSLAASNLLNSVVVPAVVAAAVALLIEYAAKPSIEARKERVLRARRALWELRDALVVLDERLSALEYATRQSLGEEDLASFEREIDVARQQLWLAEDLGARAAHQLPAAIWSELSFAHGRHRAMFDGAESVKANVPPAERGASYRLVFRNLGSNFALPRDYLLLPSRAWLRRRKIVQRAQRRDEWRDVNLPDDDAEQERLDELAFILPRALGEEGAKELVAILEQPGDGWVAAVNQSDVRPFIFSLLMEIDPDDETARIDVARRLRLALTSEGQEQT